MDRTIEVVTHLETTPERIIGLLAADPARILTGTASPDHGDFVARIDVEVGGGTSLSQEVDVVFGRLPSEAGVARFGLSWRARSHEHLFPVFGGDLEVHPDEGGSRLRLAGYYSLPLGALGVFGDGLLGHRIARRALQDFLDDAASRVAGADDDLLGARSGAGPRREGTPRSELYIG